MWMAMGGRAFPPCLRQTPNPSRAYFWLKARALGLQPSRGNSASKRGPPPQDRNSLSAETGLRGHARREASEQLHLNRWDGELGPASAVAPSVIRNTLASARYFNERAFDLSSTSLQAKMEHLWKSGLLIQSDLAITWSKLITISTGLRALMALLTRTCTILRADRGSAGMTQTTRIASWRLRVQVPVGAPEVSECSVAVVKM